MTFSGRGPWTIDVYPHPALLSLLSKSYRVPYKTSRSRRYWPGAAASERWANLLCEFEAIRAGLQARLGAIPLIPDPSQPRTHAELKRYEDALDAIVCAWVGTSILTGGALPYGDEIAAIWVPGLA